MSKIGVVFVHGFTGGDKTWQNSAGMTFTTLLKNSSIGNSFEFFEFSYYTKLVDIFDSAFVKRVLGSLPLMNKLPFVKGRIKKNQPIESLSEMLDTYIRLNLSHLDEVVLIAHSLGGLITKDYLLNSCTTEKPAPAGFVSIAVPHKGSLSAALLAPLNNVNAKELVPLQAYPDKLNTEWVHRKDSLPKTIYVVALHDECVPKLSAIPYKVGKTEVFSVPHDHISVCKPENTEDLVFKCVFNFLQEIAQKFVLQALTQTTFPADSPVYDKEIFVIKMIICGIGSKGIANAKDSFFQAEIVAKAADRKDREVLVGLQSRVLNLYRVVYNEHSGKVTPNDVFAKVHSKIIDQDASSLRCGVEFMTFLHKQGLLHQLANKLNDDVIWSDDTDLGEVEARTQ